MALLWIDSFDGYANTGAGQGYDLGATGQVGAGGRGGGRAIEVSGTGLTKSIPSLTEIIVGYASYIPGSGALMLLGNAGTRNFLQFNINAVGQLSGVQHPESGGATLFTVMPGARIFNAWRYFEHKLKIGSGTTGSYELRIDETPVVTLTGIDTQAGLSPATISYLSFGGALGTLVDDLYISDTTNGPNFPTNPDNDFQGDLRMMNIHPNGPVLTAWTPHSLPDNWDEVNDITTDNLATYVQTGTVTTKDIYDYEDPNLPPGTTIVACATMTSAARLGDAGPRQLTAYIRGGVGTATATTEVSGGVHQLSDTYYMEQFLRAQNPATGARWTASEVDKIRAGFALTE